MPQHTVPRALLIFSNDTSSLRINELALNGKRMEESRLVQSRRRADSWNTAHSFQTRVLTVGHCLPTVTDGVSHRTLQHTLLSIDISNHSRLCFNSVYNGPSNSGINP
ncbi:hypothetical protein TNCV_1795241 [Trichonephila clavipes]|nr:hypothetical protein TNCV_1795241 [Trichonephila clavipes]